LTGPDPVAAEDDADALVGVLAADELAADELDELEEELHPTAASPRKASPTTASRPRVDRNVSMIPTLASLNCVVQ
jgi:hypothetical protein